MGGSCTQLEGKKYAVLQVIQIRDVPNDVHDALAKAAMTEMLSRQIAARCYGNAADIFCSEPT